jgi:GTPase SAR1 family protein
MMDMNNTMVRSGNPDLSQEFLQPLFQNSGGFVLLFDVTSRASFDRITGDGYMRIFKNRRKTTEYGPSGIAAYPAGRQRFGCILVGNKADRESEREVRRELAQWWADSQNMKYFELDTYKQFPINEAVAELVRSTRRAQRYDEEDLDEEMESIEKEAAASVSPALKEKRTLSGSFQHALKKLSP